MVTVGGAFANFPLEWAAKHHTDLPPPRAVIYQEDFPIYYDDILLRSMS